MDKGIFREVGVPVLTAAVVAAVAWYAATCERLAVLDKQVETLEEWKETTIADVRTLVTDITNLRVQVAGMTTSTQRMSTQLAAMENSSRSMRADLAQIEKSTKSMGAQLVWPQSTPTPVPVTRGNHNEPTWTHDPEEEPTPLPAWDLVTLSTDSDVETPATDMIE